MLCYPLQAAVRREDNCRFFSGLPLYFLPACLFRLSHSDSDSDNSADSCLPSREPPPSQKLPPSSNKVLGIHLVQQQGSLRPPSPSPWVGGIWPACLFSLTCISPPTHTRLRDRPLHFPIVSSLVRCVFSFELSLTRVCVIVPPNLSQVSGRKSPEACSKPEKILKKGTYDKVSP